MKKTASLPDLILEGVVYKGHIEHRKVDHFSRGLIRAQYDLPDRKCVNCTAYADETTEDNMIEDMAFRVNQINADPELQRQVLAGEY